jgi:hypothetical protein
MGKRSLRTMVVNPPTSVLELANSLDAEMARYIDFLLMEINANQMMWAEERSKLEKKLPYAEVLKLIAQIGIRSQMLAHYHEELDRALDKIMVLAPDIEE